MVFIGTDMDEAAIRKQLDDCLLNNAEFMTDHKSWEKLPDPFPEWNQEQFQKAS